MSLLKVGKYNGKNNPMYGKSGKLAPNYGKKLSEETKNKIRLKKIGRTTDYIKSLYKKVNQYDLDGNFIKEWESMSQIRKELNIPETHISKVCKGKGKTSHGFIWKYKEN